MKTDGFVSDGPERSSGFMSNGLMVPPFSSASFTKFIQAMMYSWKYLFYYASVVFVDGNALPGPQIILNAP